MSNTDFNTLEKLLTKLPKNKTVKLSHTRKTTFSQIVGHDLANELIKLSPNPLIISQLSTHLPERTPANFTKRSNKTQK